MIAPALQRLRQSRLGRRKHPATSAWAAVVWWEMRRPVYNALVGVVGVVTTLVILLIAFVVPMVPFFPGVLLLPIVGVLGYGIMANVCYTGGWISELVIRRAWPGESEAFASISFTLGLILSVLLTLLPAIVMVIAATVVLGLTWGGIL